MNRLKTFYLVGSDESESLNSLLHRLYVEIQEIEKNQKIEVVHLYASKPQRTDLYAESFLVCSYQEINRSEYNADFNRKQELGTVKAHDYSNELVEHDSLNRLIFRLPQGPEQDNILILLEELNKELTKRKNAEILDVTFIAPIDGSALSHPELHVYFCSIDG